MASLSRESRKALEKACTTARTVAERAAEKALRGLAVADKEKHRSMTSEQEQLRNRLRAHARQLGDKRNAEKGTQEIDHLVSECAYEQWHRMLFARFLAENQLLIEPESGVPISVDEVKELARDRNVDWIALAGEFAVSMLPQVFRTDDPVLRVPFAPEDRKQLEALLQSLSPEIFSASDSLGWCYQFWQAEKKASVNKAGNKIGADELPSVTQLFTEDYMVDFLLDNTLGAWHAGKVLAANPKLAETAQTEDELRQAVALADCTWKYLRFVQTKDGKWTPGAGTFEGWPKTTAAVRALDPCMGSGHFVVAMFERLVALRLAEERLDEAATVAAVIRDNLFGLEIDPRCTQIGAFNLALAAWRRVGYCTLPAMNLACSGIAPNTREADWLAIAGDNEKLKNGMERLYRLFQKSTVLGSLINPRAGEGDLLVAEFNELQPLLEKALAQETKDDSAYEMAVAARGLAKAAEILAGQFTLVGTNVPYLGIRQQNEPLIDYCEKYHYDARHDLATCFIERGFEFLWASATQAVVAPQSWLFSGSYKKMRCRLLETVTWNFVAPLGSGAFETISGEVVNVALLGWTRSEPTAHSTFMAVNVEESTGSEKPSGLAAGAVDEFSQSDQVTNPDSRVVLHSGETSEMLSEFAKSLAGIQNGDSPCFLRHFWEVTDYSPRWAFMQSAVQATDEVGGLDTVIDYDLENGHLRAPASWRRDALHDSDQRGKQFWGRNGVTISRMGKLPCARYFGTLFDQGSAVLVPNDGKHLAAIWAYVTSPEYCVAVRRLDKKLNVTSATLAKVPFDMAHWQRVAAEKYPHGLPKPLSSDPTQWLFNGQPAGADQPLHVAVARLLGYQWPRRRGSSFPDCPALDPDELETLADDDGIVPISPVKGEGPAAERLRELLARAYGEDWNTARQEALLAQADYAGASLEDWLRNGFFEQHCALFHNRPFVWHLWDGLKDGFHVLVDYHNLCAEDGGGHRSLEKLTFTYLGDWISFQRAEQKAGKEGADGKLAAALHLQEQLKLILDGEPPFDLFVRWKPLREQAVGWDPDVNDGVRMNIRPFMSATTLNGRSIFRKAPKIKWDKDRGNEPERVKQDFPWFWSLKSEHTDFMGSREFDGKRWNDMHYSNAVKRAAREATKGKRR